MEAYIPDSDGRKRSISEFFANSGQQFLPILELLMDAKGQLHDFTHAVGVAAIEGLLELSAAQIAGDRHPGKAMSAPAGSTPLRRHGHQNGVVCMGKSKLRVKRPRLRTVPDEAGQSVEIEPPAYTTLKNDPAIRPFGTVTYFRPPTHRPHTFDASPPSSYPPPMPRVARIVITDVPHHVTQRGNNRQNVFFVDDDRRAYLTFLAEESRTFGLTIRGYCLMDNHVHLVVIPQKKTSLARAIGRTHWRYAQYINRMHRRSGHLWQNRFFSCPLDRRHTWEALVYTERNPVRAGLATRASDYPWSSAAAHTSNTPGIKMLDTANWPFSPQEWRALLQRPDDQAMRQRLHQCTTRGRPLGSDNFISKLEKKLGRRLRPLPVGRPKNISDKTAKSPGRPRAKPP